MPTIRELFSKKVKGLTKGLYEGSKIYIESQGAINPPRLKALALASPNSIADLAGITAAAALGIPIGYANRPSDTIFNNNGPFAKPLIGLLGPLAQRNLPNLIGPGKKYYVKQAPAPYQVVNQIKNGIKTNPLGTLLTAARNELRDGTIREIFAKRTEINDKYGTQWQHLGTRSKPLNPKEGPKDRLFSQYAPVYDTNDNELNEKLKQIKFPKKLNEKNAPKILAKFNKKYGKSPEVKDKVAQVALVERSADGSAMVNGVSKWDQINTDLLNGKYLNVTDLEKVNTKVNVPYVAFQIYGTNEHIMLPGTISGLSEDIEPTWNNYKYVGSPFNTYRYSGVERSIKFDLKLYADTKVSLVNLQSNLERLRETTFPDKNVTQIGYAIGKEITNGFSPNLVFLTISGYYKKLFGFIDGLNISVDDGVPWPTLSNTFDGVTDEPYPAVINVSISMKIIEAIDLGITDKKETVLIYNMTDTSTSMAFREPPKSANVTAAGSGLDKINKMAQDLGLPPVGKLGVKAPSINIPNPFKGKFP